MPKINAEGFSVTQPRLSADKDGSLVVQYYVDDVACPVVFLKDPEAKSAAAYRSIIKDLEYVRSACELAQVPIETNEPSYLIDAEASVKHLHLSSAGVVIVRALYLSSTVTYAKAFSQAHGRGLKLDENAIFKDVEMKRLHRRIIVDRHEYVAHAGNNSREASNTVVVLSPSGKQEILDGPFAHSTFLQAPHGQ
jgi:hypothetical protein